MKVWSVNPSTGRRVRSYDRHTPADIERACERALEAFRAWSRTSVEERAEKLRAAAAVLRARRDEFARLATEEMGKTIRSAEAELEKCALVCEYYASEAARFLAVEEAPTDAGRSFVRFDPLGPVLAVMPWNFPFWQVFRFAAPALAAGNVGILKHASNVPGCSLAIEGIFGAAGFPEACFQSLLITASEAEALVADPRVRAVTLTGSDAAGQSVGAAAGRALKKVVLELGGSDPFLVFADADLPRAAEAAATARCINSGQSCIAAKRFIAEERCLEEFEALFRAALERLVVGDPLSRSSDVGPLAREDLVTEIERQVRESIGRGARLVTGGRRRGGEGFYYEPTLLADVTRGMPVWDEETFAPVAALRGARDEDEAMDLASDTPYGLGASVWTRDPERALRLAARMEAGAVFVNGIVKSDPRLPFGGIKRSGHGRELAVHGIREFVNVKSVWIA